jgi:hypothetical protein
MIALPFPPVPHIAVIWHYFCADLLEQFKY